MVLPLAAAPLLTAPNAAAEDNPDWHGKCSTRISPTEANYVDGWANIHDEGANWQVWNIYANVRNAGGSEIRSDNLVTVEVANGSRIIASHKFEKIVNADITLTADVYPPQLVPKGQLSIRTHAITGIDIWPKLCDGVSLVF
ncbi:hypothetical protein [Nocardia abscessus]|uniref:hypothetical protein n=1 Tax=Nocardia abscessus TaxID=120957 RepID=UPI0024538818|nr:hypothetical protein [Nocardia abscessus]